MINHTPLSIKKVKEFSKKNPNYNATHYLCLIPELPANTDSPFYGSWASARYANGEDPSKHSAYWAIFTPGQKGYELATEKYPIKNTKNGSYPKSLLRSHSEA